MTDTQRSAPILEALESYTKQASASFGVPGHKSGLGAPADIKRVVGAAACTADATTQKGIDDRRETQHTMRRAEHLAAEAWGADVAYLSTNCTSLSNHAAEDWLTETGSISLGLSDDRHLLACFTLGNVDADADALVTAIHGLADWAGPQRGKGRPPGMPHRRDLPTSMVMTPAEAFFGRTEAVPLERAAGRLAAEMVAPYPSGIPRLVPGQRIEDVHVAFLRLGLEAGFFPAGLRDPDMQSLRVVA
jgi:arginine decarboxylase